MKQFLKILKFELKGYFTNKIFVGVTAFLMVLLVVVMFFPQIKDAFASEGEEKNEEKAVMLVCGDLGEYTDAVRMGFIGAFPDYQIEFCQGDVEQKIRSGEAECAFVMESLISYKYYVNNLSMYDANTMVADEVLTGIYRMSALVDSGLSMEEADAIMATPVSHETETLGKDQTKNFGYTYVMIMALYMVLVMYGQMVATNVATEKSSRAMELLITSAKPSSMMFGKVIASCIAGFVQLALVFGTAMVCFNLNKSHWGADSLGAGLFDMPLYLLGYMLVFFVLGFLVYAFMYAAVASTASKLEDINTSTMPITLLFVIAFMIIIVALADNEMDTMLMKVCSFIPFTSPMAMFSRICMSTVPWYEIGISIVILMGSVVGIGVLSAKIYRMGVLMYGNPPKIGQLLKTLKKK